MTVRDIQKAVVYRVKPESAIINGKIFGGYESDIMMLTRSGYLAEVEIKLSVSDFKADFRKSWSSFNGEAGLLKHDFLRRGDGANQFYFAFPKGMVAPEQVPLDFGIIEITKHEFGQYAEMTRGAKFLHKNKPNEGVLRQMLITAYFKWFNGKDFI